MSSELKAIAQQMITKGKGILAADESNPTIKKRFDAIGIETSESLRRDYREMLFTTPKIGQWISGAILYDETLRQKASDGRPFTAVLEQAGVLPGIKVDMGAKPLAGFPGETYTLGLDELRGRLTEYHQLGARFAKWRAVITIDQGKPSRFAIEANARALAHYAALCQEAGMVPIVEPEVLMNGDHDINRCGDVTQQTLNAVFQELAAHRVQLEGMLLKPNMVVPGLDCPVQTSVSGVAQKTQQTLLRSVPAAVPGVVFLSGGQSEVVASAHLNEMNRIGGNPWKLSFSYGRALQSSSLKVWAGNPSKLADAQKAFAHRAHCNSAATLAGYSEEMEAEYSP